MYAQAFALMQSLHMGDTRMPIARGTVNRVVQGVIIHPWQALRDRIMSIIFH